MTEPSFREKLLAKQNETLERENAELREKLRQLQTQLVPQYTFPHEWNFEQIHRKLLTVLLTAYPQRKTVKQLLPLLYEDGDGSEQSLHNTITRLRQHLDALNLPIEINSVRQAGIVLTTGSHDYLKQYLRMV